MRPRGTSLQQSSASALGDGDAALPKKKRNRPGNPKPDAEVIALSPRTLLATNRFVCEVCSKGFQRDQNLQLHLRGHNMPWKLKQKDPKDARRRVYLCPEPTCVHHSPSRALGDLTGIKKHYCRKHGEKKFRCDRCSKRYAVESDWKAHGKTCGAREYRCHCNALFSRKDNFITHRATCDAAVRGTAQKPPLVAGLYVGSGSDDRLGLSDAAAQMHGFADQGQSSSAAEASQFDHVMPSYSGSSMFRSQASDFSLSFFLGGGTPLIEQDLSDNGGDLSEGSQGPLLHGKAPLHGVMTHLPEQQYQPNSGNANVNLLDIGFFSGNSGGTSGSQGPLLHGKEPFHSHDLTQLPEQQHQPGSSNARVNLPNLGVFSGNSGGWPGSSHQDARLVIQDQLNGGSSSNTEHGNGMASIGSHFGGGFVPSLHNSSPSAGLSATALLMKAAQMGSTTSSTTHNPNGPSALLRAAGFAGTASVRETSSRAAEEEKSHEAYFHDLIMNSLPLTGGGTGGLSGLAGVDDGNVSTRDFLGVGRDDATAPQGLHGMGAPNPTQMKWYM
ncbi:protein indeterminate-domain 6, chloroplastic [Zea mays]|uniref:Protein indeterminate-domain 5 chloroplastic n=1 Tax=Zea mays TaxID=4577 RepID=A0A1D6EUS6_MAIZE|nr:protein indeterminate-domain 6, chloroplastic [Zea mays]ONM23407.1 Protein indeterminate-domain 5 chloroplastic [Zea mays]|eukprot:XP_008670373.1 protein indeterminate-domain 6, chloroplastic [Zea mays]